MNATQTMTVSVSEVMLLNSVDACWFADLTICDECESSFDWDRVDYLGDGRYRSYCWNDICDNFIEFDNDDILSLKRKDDHYWMVREVVQYNMDNGIPMVISSINSDRICDGHHRLAAAIELGMTEIVIDSKNHALMDEPEDWARESPALMMTEDGSFVSARKILMEMV